MSSQHKSNDEVTRGAHDQKKNQFQLQTIAAAATPATPTAAASVTKATTRSCCILNAGQLIKQLMLLITSVVLTMFYNNNNYNNNNKKLYKRTLRTRSRSRRTKKNRTQSYNNNDNSKCSDEEQQHSYNNNNTSNNKNNCEYERDKKHQQRLCCRFGTVFILKVFVLIIMMIMILATTRVAVVAVHGQQLNITESTQSSSSGGGGGVEVSEKHYNKSNKINVDNIGSSSSNSNSDISLSSEEHSVEEEEAKSISTRLGVDLIKSNNMFTTAEVVVKENDQEAQQQQKIVQEVKTSAKLNKNTHTHARARTRTRTNSAQSGTGTGISTAAGTARGERDGDRETNSDSFAVADDNAEAEAEHEHDIMAEAEAEAAHEHEAKVVDKVDDAPPPPPPPPADSTLLASIPAAGAASVSSLSSTSSSSSSSTSAAARNIINLMSRENVVLKRQLREKAKHDSLESIKMHILMRLKLTKLPNITSPIPVPQSILENFYKTYNATRSNSTWRRGSHKSPILSYKNDNHMKTQHPYERSDAADFEKEQLQSDDAYAYANSQSADFNGDDDEDNNDDSYDNASQFYSSMSSYDNENYDDNDESIMSHINSIYIFPEIIRIRHNRRADLLHFKLDSNSDVSRATMHLYIRGLDWIKEHEPSLLGDIAGRQVVVAIHKAVRRPNATNYTHKLKVLESRHEVPSGVGQWVKINVLPLFSNWLERRNDSHEILINGIEPWMRPLIVTTESTARTGPLTVHIEIGSRTKHRYKRSTSLDCQESDHEDRCCRYPLKVNFRTFGWNFVIAPTSFDAYFCNGECKVGYLEHYTHTHLTSLTASATPCCSPTKMSALNLLYFDDNNQLVMSVIPNMSVEKCSCS